MSGRRIAAVLRIRELQEQRARGELAVDRRAHRAAHDAEVSTWAALDRRSASATGAVSAAALHALTSSGALAAETQHATTTAAAERAEGSAARWTVAARRVEALERLADRLVAAEREERARLAGNELDDLVLARFGRDVPARRPQLAGGSEAR